MFGGDGHFRDDAIAVGAVEDVAAARAGPFEDVQVAAARGGFLVALRALLLAFLAGAYDDDGDGRVLEAVLRDGAGEEALDPAEALAARADDEDGGFVDLDLGEGGLR